MTFPNSYKTQFHQRLLFLVSSNQSHININLSCRWFDTCTTHWAVTRFCFWILIWKKKQKKNNMSAVLEMSDFFYIIHQNWVLNNPRQEIGRSSYKTRTVNSSSKSFSGCCHFHLLKSANSLWPRPGLQSWSDFYLSYQLTFWSKVNNPFPYSTISFNKTTPALVFTYLGWLNLSSN